MSYWLENLKRAYSLAEKAKEKADGILRKVDASKREVGMEALLEPEPQLKQLLHEGDRFANHAASLAGQAMDAFLVLWRVVPESVRLEFYAWRHGLEIENGHLIAFVKLRRAWTWEGVVADLHPGVPVGSMELLKKRPPYWTVAGADTFARIKVLEGELPKDPGDFVKCSSFEIIKVS